MRLAFRQETVFPVYMTNLRAGIAQLV